jgi:hypothetical protein
MDDIVENSYKMLDEEVKTHLKNPSVDGRIILD